jgi:anthranilate phosphoribosyltransferase
MSFAGFIEPFRSADVHVSADQAEALLRFVIDEGTVGQVGAMLGVLDRNSVDSQTLLGFARLLRTRASTVDAVDPNAIDTCGTGGGAATFNMSTAVGLAMAALGVTVAKHGNRAVTSKCGSADVLEYLGIPLHQSPETAARALEDHRFAFLMAPAFHPAMAKVGPVRRELGFRTVFNLLGPLLNPAGVRRQLIGLYDADLLQPVAGALAGLGVERAVVASGTLPNGEALDEVSPCGTTQLSVVNSQGEIENFAVKPDDFGVSPVNFESIAAGKDASENAEMIRLALSEVDSAYAQAILPSVSVAWFVAGKSDSLYEGAAVVRSAIESGTVASWFERFIAASRA